MSDAAAFDAQYISFRYLKGPLEYSIELRVPKHKWQAVYAALGDPPDAGVTKWVGVARLADRDAAS